MPTTVFALPTSEKLPLDPPARLAHLDKSL
jgi:hypothetical protein